MTPRIRHNLKRDALSIAILLTAAAIAFVLLTVGYLFQNQLPPFDQQAPTVQLPTI